MSIFTEGVILKRKKTDRTRVLMIVNPRSGRRKPFLSAGKIADLFANRNMEVGIYFTSLDYNADYLVNEHGEEAEIVACCGGDGTISDIIKGMMKGGVQKPLGYMPAGTTNDLARSLGMQTNMMKSAKTIVYGRPRPLDVGSFDDDYFIYIASFGAFTEVSYATPQKAKNLFGRLAYLFNAFRYMNKISSHHVKVNADTRMVEGDYIFGAVTNSKSVAGIFKFDDDMVDFNDGLYEVLLIKKPKKKLEVIGILLSMLNKSYKNENITLFRASEVDFIMDEELDWAVDGECMHGGRRVHIKNNKHAVNIIMRNRRLSARKRRERAKQIAKAKKAAAKQNS